VHLPASLFLPPPTEPAVPPVRAFAPDAWRAPRWNTWHPRPHLSPSTQTGIGFRNLLIVVACGAMFGSNGIGEAIES
jgi:hypothetical protein